jgi:hypothetical protein
MIPFIGMAARLMGPAMIKKTAGAAMSFAKTPMGKGAIGGYIVGRNQNMQQGQADGAPKNENMQGYFPGRGGY